MKFYFFALKIILPTSAYILYLFFTLFLSFSSKTPTKVIKIKKRSSCLLCVIQASVTLVEATTHRFTIYTHFFIRTSKIGL